MLVFLLRGGGGGVSFCFVLVGGVSVFVQGRSSCKFQYQINVSLLIMSDFTSREFELLCQTWCRVFSSPDS